MGLTSWAVTVLVLVMNTHGIDQDLAARWLDRYYGDSSDRDDYDGWDMTVPNGGRTIIELYCSIDLDFTVAHLLRVSTGPTCSTVWFLGLWSRGSRIRTHRLTESMPFFDQTMEGLREAHLGFIEWAFRVDAEEAR